MVIISNINIDKSHVGLANVDNTSDADKPVSTAQAAALSGKQDSLVSGTNVKTVAGQSIVGAGNVGLNKSDVGLANVDNTSDANKPVSTAQATALAGKQNTLVSGTSIKTIDGQSLLGSGNIAFPTAVADSQSRTIFNQIIDDIDQNIRCVFNGSTSTGLVNTPLVISAVGDFIEFELKCNVFNATTQRGILGEVGASNSSIGIGTSSGNLRMRATNGSWFASSNILNSNLTTTERPLIRVENVAGVWKSYKNGVFQKDLIEGGTSFTLAAFGHAYDSVDRFNGEIAKLKVRAQGVNIDFGSLINSPLVTMTNVTVDKGPEGFLNTNQAAVLADTLVDYAPCFYQVIYNTGGTVFESVMVYFKIKGKTKYVGVKIERRINAGVKQDVYKILNGFEYTYNPVAGTMTANPSVIFIADGESEFVYKIAPSAGGVFTGGGHGYETLTKALFYAGGVPIDISTAKPLTRCESFEYIQESTCWNAVTPTQADGVHIKHTKFIPYAKKIETINTMSWSRTETISIWYQGIFCLGKGVSTNVRNEFFEQLATPATTPEVNPALPSNRAFELVGNNTATGYSGRVSARITRPLSMAQNLVSNMFIAVRVDDTKYYEQESGSVVNGDVWANKQEIFFDTI